MIPLFATRAVLDPLIEEIALRQRAVLDSGRYILGPEVSAFEAEFANYLGVKHCVGVANGTDAIAIALRAVGVGPGDEVVVPASTFFATAEAVVSIGAKPVFCDIDAETYCMTEATAEPLINKRTRALLPVDLFGNLAATAELRELAEARGLYLVEDAAQAAGASLDDGKMAGSLSDVATFSFYPGKNLGAFGDGGAVVTDDDQVAETARLLRFHGSKDKKIHSEIGYNSRLDDLQAAALRVLLPHLEQWTATRREVADAYRKAGLDDLVQLPKPTTGCSHCYHLYVVRSATRDRLQQKLTQSGVESRPYYTVPMHLQPALSSFADGKDLPEAERLANQNLALPMGPALSSEQVETVVEAVSAALNGVTA